MMKAILDNFLSKWTSRKLMVFLIATILAGTGYLNSGDWSMIAVVYIGTQGAVDFFTKMKYGNSRQG